MWVSPTGHNDPDSQWGSELHPEEHAYDENTDTYAVTGSVSYLELTHSAINCDKVRVWLYKDGDADVDIDVFYGGAWHNIWSGVITENTWVEKSIGSTQSITKARVKQNAPAQFGLFEFDFGQVGEKYFIG